MSKVSALISKNKGFRFLFIVFYLAPALCFAQNQLIDDFSSSLNWTQVGTNVSINTARVEYINSAFDGQQRRIHRPFGDTLNSLDTFSLEIEFTPYSVGSQGTNKYTGHVVLGITAGTKEPFNNCSSIACSGYPLGVQDGVMVNYITRNPSTDSIFFIIKIKDSIAEFGGNTRIYTNNTFNSTFYLRLEKFSCAGLVSLSVFSDPGRTTHLPGSPIFEPLPLTVEGLNTLQIGNVTRGDFRRGLNGIADNLNLEWSKNYKFINLGSDTSVCVGDSVLLGSVIPNASYLWSNGATDSLIYVNQAGLYWVEVVRNGCIERDSIRVTYSNQFSFSLGADSSICRGDSVLIGTSVMNASYNWNNGATTPFINTNQSGLFWLEANVDGCVKRDSIVIDYINPIPFNLGSDLTLCRGDSIELGTTLPNATYLWNDGSTNSFLTAKQAGTYWLEVVSNGCTERDSIAINFFNPIEINLGVDTFMCQGDSVVLGRVIPNATYLWSNGFSTPFISTKQDGLFWLEATINACKSRDSILVSYSTPISVSLGKDTTLCSGDSILLDAKNAGSNYTWNTGKTEQVLTVKQRGNYSVKVTNRGCKAFDTIKVSYLNPIQLNLKVDSILCIGETILLDASNQNVTEFIWQDFSDESFYVVNQEGEYSVVASNKCESKSDTVFITQTDCDCRIYIPNIFSPNSDRLNDRFGPVYSCDFSFYLLKVFNRWGEQIFESSDPGIQWNGKENTEGSYVYILEYSTINQKPKKLTGVFTLVR